MRSIRNGVLIAAAASSLNAGSSWAAADPPTIKDLQDAPIELNSTPPKGIDAEKTMDSYRRFLDLNAGDAALRAEALRRLADLKLESSESERIERELVTNEGLRATEAIHLYTALLKAYPHYERNDEVLYQLARAYELNAQPEQALAALDRLVAGFPHSRFIDEVQFRRGELLFAAKSYPAAQAAYAAVIQVGATSLYYNQSLYKEGWSRFKQGDNERSLDSFASVLDSVLIAKRDPPTLIDFDSLSRPNRELVEDTFRVMSITFSYLDGAKSIGAFLERSGPRPYAYLLYTRLGDLYLEKERYTDAADTYHAFVARDPGNEQAPALQLKAMQAYAKGGFALLVLQAKKDFLEGYGFGTPYWRTRTPQGEPVVADELKKNLQDVAQFYHAQAQRSHGAADYQEAVKWYRAFLTSFPTDPLCAQMNFMLADTLYESKHYLEAAQEYDRTASGYGEHPKAAAAGYAAIVALGKEEESLSGTDKARVHAREIDSSLKFAQAFPLYPETPQVLIRAATDLYTAKDYTRAMAAAQAVLDRQPPADAQKQRIAWTVVANAEFDRGDFAKAETSYSRALGLMAPRDPERSAIVERLAAAIYREGEEKNKSGNGVGAVEDFLRVAKEAPASPIRATADFDAAALLMSQKEWARAITVLEQFRRDYPQSPLQPDVTRKLAVAYAESNRAAPAAAEFARIAHSSGEPSEVQREALQRSAELYEKTGDMRHARAALEEFVARFPQPLSAALEARNKLGIMAAQSADGKARDHWLREIIVADRNAGAARTDRSRALAARATLTLAEPARAEFMQTKLAAPLKKSLLQKRRSMEAALKQYEQAADYQIADVTTAATYESAELYRQLAKDLLNSERPRNLSPSELQQYNVLLEEQAFPFEEKAIKLHEVNAARAKDGSYDEWVQKSFAALAQLNPGRYAKVEIGSAVSRDSRLGEAEADLKSQVERRPDDAAAGNELGIIERKLGKFAEAEATYERTIAQVPNYASTYLNLGVLYDLYLAEPRKALAQFERYLQLTGGNKQVAGWVVELQKRAGVTRDAKKEPS